MNYKEALKLYSDSYLGAVLTSADNVILDINEYGMQLLRTDRSVCGQTLEQSAPFLCTAGSETGDETHDIPFANPEFGHYARACAVISGDYLPSGTRIITFRDASPDVKAKLLESVYNHIRESVTIWDNKGRMLMLNDASIRLQVHTSTDDIGKYVEDLYEPQNNGWLVIPKVLNGKHPILNLRQDFLTHLGKELQTVSDNYPVMNSGEILAAYSMMDDYTEMNSMQVHIIRLQHELLKREDTPTKSRKSALTAHYIFDDIIYSGKKMKTAIERCRMIAVSDYPVMIYGETGTGKELFAQSIHNASSRSEGPFIAINCAAIPTTLLESILFGTEKGAYTGADKREGLFEQANGGTLLLDEINSMDIGLQSKLLRVIQEGTFYHVGGTKPIHVNVRIISNINMLPEQAIRDGLLRDDLYYRLGVIVIKIPPLRERKEDIYLLCKNFIKNTNEKLLKNADSVSQSVEMIFHEYDWPGNVRELQHAIEFALNIIPNDESVITPKYLPDRILEAVHYSTDSTDSTTPEVPEDQSLTMDELLQETGQRYLRRALDENDGNISRTAKAMGITRQNLQHRMKKYGIS
ncbi:MAG: sigma 54-interacting transcriptional regulator [Eubacteriaceae bacterium]|jgi:arginine utilization regulatory protein|nr:sigma 54-interacting transcriptional regulator [Eubacteriaceae bacterium]